MTKEQVIYNYIIFLFRDFRNQPDIVNNVGIFRIRIFVELRSMFYIDHDECLPFLLKASQDHFDPTLIAAMLRSGTYGVAGRVNGVIRYQPSRVIGPGPTRVPARRKLQIS